MLGYTMNACMYQAIFKRGECTCRGCWPVTRGRVAARDGGQPVPVLKRTPWSAAVSTSAAASRHRFQAKRGGACAVAMARRVILALSVACGDWVKGSAARRRRRRGNLFAFARKTQCCGSTTRHVDFSGDIKRKISLGGLEITVHQLASPWHRAWHVLAVANGNHGLSTSKKTRLMSGSLEALVSAMFGAGTNVCIRQTLVLV
jgi:hypothetical protein